MLQPNKYIVHVLRGAGIAFVLRGVGSGLAFSFNVAIGRLLGADGAGLYFLALSVASIGAVVSKLGLDSVLLRFIAAGASTGNWNSVVGVFKLGTRLAAGVSLMASVSVIAGAQVISLYIFGEPGLTIMLRAIGFGIFTFSMMMLMAESLKGLQEIRNAMLVSGVFHPLFALTLIWPLVKILGPAGASIAYVIGTGAAAIIGRWMWAKRMRVTSAASPGFDLMTLFHNSRHLWVSNVITGAILPWMPLFYLGVSASASEVGVFGAASRVSMLVTFFLVAVNTAIAPTFAALYAKGEIDRIRHLALIFSILITVAASPLFLLLIFGNKFVMSFFGADFVSGGDALAIIAVGQAIVCFTGVGGQILMMTGHVKQMRNGSVLAFAVTVFGSLSLIPLFGTDGAAITTALSVATINVYLFSVSLWKLYKRTL